MNFDAVKAELGEYIRRAVGGRSRPRIRPTLRQRSGSRSGPRSIITGRIVRENLCLSDYEAEDRGLLAEAYKHKKAIAAAKTELVEASAEPFEENAGTVLPTPAELRILKAMSDGQTNEKIAKALFLSWILSGPISKASTRSSA